MCVKFWERIFLTWLFWHFRFSATCSGSKLWLTITIPHSYISTSWPIRVCWHHLMLKHLNFQLFRIFYNFNLHQIVTFSSPIKMFIVNKNYVLQLPIAVNKCKTFPIWNDKIQTQSKCWSFKIRTHLTTRLFEGWYLNVFCFPMVSLFSLDRIGIRMAILFWSIPNLDFLVQFLNGWEYLGMWN